MLAHLSVNNFAIVKYLQLELSKGMTTITGKLVQVNLSRSML